MNITVKTFFVLILLFATNLLYAQKFSYPKIKSTGKTLKDFVTSKWFLKDSALGDLNGDKSPDLAAVLEYKDTIQELRPDGYDNTGSPRILVIFLKNNKTGNYDLFLQNNTFIIRYGEGGMDPEAYGEVKISKGILEVFVAFLRGNATYKFRFQKNDFYLIGASNNGVSGGKIYGFDVNFLTKKAKVEEGNMEDEKMKVKWLTIPIKQLKRLRDLKMIMTWEVIPNQYI